MSGYNRVIELAATYTTASDDHADVELESDQAAGITLTLLHECLTGDVRQYDLVGQAQLKLVLISGESLTMIARFEGRVVGALVNEVVCCEERRLLLAPKGGYNTIVYQSCLDPDDDRSAPRAGIYEVETLTETNRTTQALGALLTAALGYYAGKELPESLALLYPVLDDALADGEESNSREMLQYLCVILEGLGVQAMPGILLPYKHALAVLRTPVKATTQL